MRGVNVAAVGAGPAGLYTAAGLVKSPDDRTCALRPRDGFGLESSAAAVAGAGNVALDVAKVTTKELLDLRDLPGRRDRGRSSRSARCGRAGSGLGSASERGAVRDVGGRPSGPAGRAQAHPLHFWARPTAISCRARVEEIRIERTVAAETVASILEDLASRAGVPNAARVDECFRRLGVVEAARSR
jgi:hypothetical protein